MVHELEEMAKSVDASFIIVYKVHRNILLTWVLSGESGELVYDEPVKLNKCQHRIQKWVDCVTFTQWAEWQKAFRRAREWKTNEESIGRSIGEKDLKKATKYLISDTMKGNLPNELWKSVRDPHTFFETAYGGKTFEMLRSHYFRKADNAMEKLSELLWKPILKKCQGLKNMVQGDNPHTKPVRFSFDLDFPFL